jgi:putative ATPase
MDLFRSSQLEKDSPLAYRMRPANLDEYIGQSHIIGPGRLLRRVIQADRLSSLIFYGPPGCGKTALARVIAGTTKSAFSSLNAVLSGVKELRAAIEEAKQRKELYDRRTILFVDEVHRWNKAQQDALLPWVENGTVVLIGATTENPFFEVNSALVSRSRIFQLKPLTDEDLLAVAKQAMGDRERGYGKWNVRFEKGALEHLIEVASGDARTLLNALELAVETSVSPFPPPEEEELFVSLAAAEESIQQKVVLYDKEGDYHFDAASAFIKSIRGSDPDAALYWMAKMVRAGEDPRFIFRRMLISACEDIGMADPQALVIVEAAAAAFDRIGMPEGRFHLTHAALYLATAQKSNSSLAFFDALKAVEEDVRTEVPNHLRDANRDKEGFGHGEGYLYPHAYRDHWVEQNYLPTQMRGRLFYQPTESGYEKSIKADVLRKREAQLALGNADEEGEILTFSSLEGQDRFWIDRAVGDLSKKLETIREKIFSLAKLKRHELVLNLQANRGVLLWEAVRTVPEGGVWGEVENKEAAERLSGYGKALSEELRPTLLVREGRLLTDIIPEELRFEVVMGHNTLFKLSPEKLEKRVLEISKLIASPGRVILAETVPREGMRLSEALKEHGAEDPAVDPTIKFLQEAEAVIYEGRESVSPFRNVDEIRSAFASVGIQMEKVDKEHFFDERSISKLDITRWFDPNRPHTYGAYLATCHPEELDHIIFVCTEILSGRGVRWRQAIAFLQGEKKGNC